MLVLVLPYPLHEPRGFRDTAVKRTVAPMAKAETWKRRVAEWADSGQSAAEFSKPKDYAAGTLMWWRSRLKRLEREGRMPAIPMARVVVKREAMTREARSRRIGGVAVELAGARVTMDIGFDKVTLSAVLDVLEGRAGGGA